VVAIALASALAGCGGRPPQPPSGAAVFASSCAACHSLIGNESLHRQGGDLLDYRLSREDLLQYTRQMPVPRPLSAAELAAVVDYVRAAQQRGSAGGH
jgi:mono/diheme cytochrome c family protein